MKHQHMI